MGSRRGPGGGPEGTPNRGQEGGSKGDPKVGPVGSPDWGVRVLYQPMFNAFHAQLGQEYGTLDLESNH